jgi:hypothetical protein
VPIIDTQRRVAEIGRIRLGELVASVDGKRPRALHKFRFTSPKRDVLEKIVAEYGGEVRPWRSPAGDEWEVVSDTREVAVAILPADIGFSQWWELWDASGCVRRCDGFTESRGDEPRPCLCMAEGKRQCSATTRLTVILPAFDVWGAWRMDTTSYYASGELRTAIEFALQLAARTNGLAYGTLRIEDRVARTPGEPVKRYTVPVLDVRLDRAAIDPQSSADAVAVSAGSRPSDAAAALIVTGLPEPKPRIERGTPSPPPPPRLADDARGNVPSLPLVGRGVPSEHGAGAPVADVGLPATIPAASREADVVPPAPADAARPVDPRGQTMRALFKAMATLWPGIEPAERDERRHALAVIVTARTRAGDVATSYADLTDDELTRVRYLVRDIETGGLDLHPLEDGSYLFTTASNRQLRVHHTDGAWRYETVEPI